MRDLVILFVHLIVTVVRLARPGGFRSVVAESVLAKHQLQILNRSRKRARNLRAAERLIAGLCNLFMNPAPVLRSAIVLKPSTLLLAAAGVWASQTICDAVRIKARLSTTENDFLTLSRLMGSNPFSFVEGQSSSTNIGRRPLRAAPRC